MHRKRSIQCNDLSQMTRRNVTAAPNDGVEAGDVVVPVAGEATEADVSVQRVLVVGGCRH